jgi:hypothetical protein
MSNSSKKPRVRKMRQRALEVDDRRCTRLRTLDTDGFLRRSWDYIEEGRRCVARWDAGRFPMNLKIATWNVNGTRSREAQLCDWRERDRPDVVCLQEIKARPDQVPDR